ncbi:MAG: aminotransferase class V-fold PLP-dependent enzyme [Verrucomicrobia bacterium]|nr:aminotransferase class V-fold PLP-dependent enzyme [Verrucomicrobiota bacterium]
MTIAEILSNEDLRQQEFPVTKEKIFFGHAGVCPLPRRVSEAIRTYAQQCTLGDQETLVPSFQIQKYRQTAANLLGVQSEEIAFVGPTSLALSFVASGLDWKKGDNMLVYFDDYPSNVYPWMALAEKGVKVRFINIRELGKIRDIDIIGQVDESTRLVALASCHFVSGWRIDVKTIGKHLRKRNILFCLDSIQTLGAFPTPLQYVDFAAADAHKWLLGPCAAGLFYVRKEVQQRLKPRVFGWHNVLCPDFTAQEEIKFFPNAQRYEAGSENLLGLVGLQASMELISNVGVESIAQELLRKRSWLVPALQEKGYSVLQADAPAEHASGIISFHRDETDLGELHKSLESGGIITSLRMDRAGRKYIRLSPHFYNTDAELHRVLELL